MTASRRSAGFALAEALGAAAVAAVALGMLVAIVSAAKRAQRAEAEADAAWTAASGAFERLRGAPAGDLPGERPAAMPLPPEAAALRGAALTAACTRWDREGGVRHLRVVFSWEPRPGRTRQLVCEGLVSDARRR